LYILVHFSFKVYFPQIK